MLLLDQAELIPDTDSNCFSPGTEAVHMSIWIYFLVHGCPQFLSPYRISNSLYITRCTVVSKDQHICFGARR
jgi:hypothetical protein